jgi:hypothetical protein
VLPVWQPVDEGNAGLLRADLVRENGWVGAEGMFSGDEQANLVVGGVGEQEQGTAGGRDQLRGACGTRAAQVGETSFDMANEQDGAASAAGKLSQREEQRVP